MSYKVAQALALVDEPVMHVTDLPGHPPSVPGQSPVPDEEIAPYCGRTGTVLVTIDSDFRGRWIRTGLLSRHGVEVIVFNKDIPGLAYQHRRITSLLPIWQDDLGKEPYGHRVWTQGDKLHPWVSVGKQRRPRSRPRVTT